jgi:arylformamidase
MLDIEMIDATSMVGAPAEEDWYIMHRVVMDNHIGTHVEVPYHCFPDGADLARVPIQQFVATAAILDLRGYRANESIPLEAVKRAAEAAGGVGQGEMAFVMTGWSQYYGQDLYLTPPYLSREAMCWLMDQGIGVLGVDTSGAMDPGSAHRYNHLPVFGAGGLYIENLTNLEAVPKSRFLAVAFPPAIEGLEAWMVRVVALV